MDFIIGGAYQGKRAWAKQAYGLADGDFFTCEGRTVDHSARAVCHLERFALACVRAGLEPADEWDYAASRGQVLIRHLLRRRAHGPRDARLARGDGPLSHAARRRGGHGHAAVLRPAPEAQGMNRLVLIRHGRTDGSDRRLYYGATDLPVNEAGLRELERARGE